MDTNIGRASWRRARHPMATTLAWGLLLAAPLAWAQAPPPAARTTPAGTASGLPDWEGLTPAQRALLIAPVRERWNGAPEARARMLAHAERWQSMSPQERERAHHGMKRWRHMDEAERETARQVYALSRDLSPDERKALRIRLKGMTAAERAAWIRAQPRPAAATPGTR